MLLCLNPKYKSRTGPHIVQQESCGSPFSKVSTTVQCNRLFCFVGLFFQAVVDSRSESGFRTLAPRCGCSGGRPPSWRPCHRHHRSLKRKMVLLVILMKMLVMAGMRGDGVFGELSCSKGAFDE